MENRSEPERQSPPSRTTPARAPLPDAWWELPLRTRRRIASAIVGVAGLVLVVLVVAGWTGSSDGEPDPVAYVEALPPERVTTWDTLAECESGGDWNLDTGNGYFGGLQFTLTSWDGVGGIGSPAEASREEQIMRAEFLHEEQGWDAWPACSAELGLT